MQEYKGNIESDTVNNNNFRKVLYTAKDLQLTVMSIAPGEDIGAETHKSADQFIRCEEGKGKAVINGSEYNLKPGDIVIIPQGSEHNIINTSRVKALKIYTLYSTTMHPDLEVCATKAIALERESV